MVRKKWSLFGKENQRWKILTGFSLRFGNNVLIDFQLKITVLEQLSLPNSQMKRFLYQIVRKTHFSSLIFTFEFTKSLRITFSLPNEANGPWAACNNNIKYSLMLLRRRSRQGREAANTKTIVLVFAAERHLKSFFLTKS